jgi:hypothetical protein
MKNEVKFAVKSFFIGEMFLDGISDKNSLVFSPDLNNGHINGGGSTNGGSFGRPRVPSPPGLDASLLSNAVSALNGGSGGFHSSSTSPLQGKYPPDLSFQLATGFRCAMCNDWLVGFLGG